MSKVQVSVNGSANGRLPPAKTLADQLREQLADDILRGLLPPGIPLEEVELAKRFAVSRTPVREAIRLLVASGLVEARPHRSAVVARATEHQLAGMFEALRELECLCAGFAAERMTAAERTALKQTQAALRDPAKAEDPQRYHELNEKFHSAIYSGAHNEYLERLTTETRDRISPFSRAQFRSSGRMARSHSEHNAIVRAIVAGNAADAAAAMKTHIDSVHEAYALVRRG